MTSGLSTRLRKSAQECADENINGFGNLMTMAADEIERLNKKVGDLEHKVKLWVPSLYSGSGKTL